MMLLCSWLHDFAFFRRFLLIWWSTFHGHSSNLVVHAGCLPLPSTALRPHARRGVHGEGPLSSFFLVNGLAKISSQLNLYQVFFPATSGRVKSSEFSVAKIHEFPMVFFYRKPVGGGVGRWLSLLYFQDERGCHWCGGRCYEFHLRIFGWLWLQNPSLKFDLILKTENHGICTYYVFMSFIMKIIKVIQQYSAIIINHFGWWLLKKPGSPRPTICKWLATSIVNWMMNANLQKNKMVGNHGWMEMVISKHF